ncbi:MAG: hypothetical protein AAF804_04250 [Bacteroidota bacterium]
MRVISLLLALLIATLMACEEVVLSPENELTTLSLENTPASLLRSLGNPGGEDQGSRDEGAPERGQASDCFEIIYPIDFTMPDSSIITVTHDKDTALRAWYLANPNSRGIPALVYPIDISFKDSVISINNQTDLQQAYLVCKEENAGGEAREPVRYEGECFEFVYPISYRMPDGSVVNVISETDTALRAWFASNPNANGEAVLQFPVDLIFKDTLTITINSAEQLRRAYARCKDEDRGDESQKPCFDLVYPVTYLMPDSTTLTMSSETDTALRGWYAANPDATKEPVLQFPVNVTFKEGGTRTLNNPTDYRVAWEACKDDD